MRFHDAKKNNCFFLESSATYAKKWFQAFWLIFFKYSYSNIFDFISRVCHIITKGKLLLVLAFTWKISLILYILTCFLECFPRPHMRIPYTHWINSDRDLFKRPVFEVFIPARQLHYIKKKTKKKRMTLIKKTIRLIEHR